MSVGRMFKGPGGTVLGLLAPGAIHREITALLDLARR